MTAIFAVWNRNGLAVAADTNVSVTISDDESERTMWTDSTSKVRRLSGHNVIVAYADSTNVNGIPVMSVIDRWAETITAPLETTADYVGHFLNWLSDNPLPPNVSSSESIYSRVHRILNTLTKDAGVDQMPTSSQVADAIEYWGQIEPENLFGTTDSSWIQELLDGKLDSGVRHELSAQLDVHPSTSLEQVEEERLRLTATLEELLTERFQSNFSATGNHQEVCGLLVDYLIDYWDEELTETEMLFIGYGSKEWVPSYVSVRLASYGGQLPRACFREAFTEDDVWYVAIAQEQQVTTLLEGISPFLKQNLLEHYNEHDDAEVSRLLEDQTADRLGTMRRKIKHLSPDKLAFIARSFVEVERLGSFLMEDLPGVGGEIEVETLSR